jgi:Fe-S-cluster containining protein
MSKDKKPTGAVDMTRQQELPAGCFSSWLRRTRSALVKENRADVPCGDCIACCMSSYFIHIRPEETRTIARINKKLLFPAPGLPKGNVLLGYGMEGRCPMLIEGRCSIYEHRPLTCRSYDCRIFTAAGIAAGEKDKILVNQRVKRWKFSYPTRLDRDQHTAVKAAAAFLRERAQCFPGGAVPTNPSQLAILALKVYKVFLRRDDSGKTRQMPPDSEVAKAIMEANERFEARRKQGDGSFASKKTNKALR